MGREALGLDVAGEDEVLDDVLRRSDPDLERVQSWVVERVADRADGLDAVQRLADDAGDEGRGRRRRYA